MPSLAPSEIIKADEMRSNGHAYKSAAVRRRWSVSTTHGSNQRYRLIISVVRRRVQVRKRRTSRRDDRFLQLRVFRKSRLPAVQARNNLKDTRGVRVTEPTVHRRFTEVGIGSCIPEKAPTCDTAPKKHIELFTWISWLGLERLEAWSLHLWVQSSLKPDRWKIANMETQRERNI